VASSRLSERPGSPLLSGTELCAMAATALVTILATVLVARPLDHEMTTGLILLIAGATFAGIFLGSELAERWEREIGQRQAVLRGYGVTIPALLVVLVVVFLLL
jgi:uncharacterized PurR-regulated membrane protein YhhQ (DUF165 family)